jgi:hypothetical protein
MLAHAAGVLLLAAVVAACCIWRRHRRHRNPKTYVSELTPPTSEARPLPSLPHSASGALAGKLQPGRPCSHTTPLRSGKRGRNGGFDTAPLTRSASNSSRIPLDPHGLADLSSQAGSNSQLTFLSQARAAACCPHMLLPCRGGRCSLLNVRRSITPLIITSALFRSLR